MGIDNKHFANQLSKDLEDQAQVEKQSELLSSALKELKKLRAAELFEIEKQKRQLYGLKSEKSSSLLKSTDKDLKNDKDDFDGSDSPTATLDEFPAVTSAMNIVFPMPFLTPNLAVWIIASVLLSWIM